MYGRHEGNIIQQWRKTWKKTRIENKNGLKVLIRN